MCSLHNLVTEGKIRYISNVVNMDVPICHDCCADRPASSKFPRAPSIKRSKSLHSSYLVQGLFEAEVRGDTYPLLTNNKSNHTERSGSNIVLVKDGVLFTPDRGVLQSITCKTVIRVAHANDVQIRVEYVPLAMVYHSDGFFYVYNCQRNYVYHISWRSACEGRPGWPYEEDDL